MSLEDKVDRILENQMEQKADISAIKVDIAHHIRRSDAHEVDLKTQNNKIQKLWLAVSLLAGAGMGNAGPSVLKYLGSLL